MNGNTIFFTINNQPSQKKFSEIKEKMATQISLIINNSLLMNGFNEILKTKSKKQIFRLIGGIPRDVAIKIIKEKNENIEFEDFDVITNCSEEEVYKFLTSLKDKKGFENLHFEMIGKYFQSIRVILPPAKERIDIRFNQKLKANNYEERDFNLNCMSFEFSTESIQDSHFGLAGIFRNEIYCVSKNPLEKIEKDNLIALRAIYLSVKTEMKLERKLFSAIKKLKDAANFGNLCTNDKNGTIVMPRIFNYLAKMLNSNYFKPCIEKLINLGLLERILPNYKETCLDQKSDRIIEIIKNAREEIKNKENNDEINANLFLAFYFEKYKQYYLEGNKECDCAINAYNKTFGSKNIPSEYRFPLPIRVKMLEQAMKKLGLSNNLIIQATQIVQLKKCDTSSFFQSKAMNHHLIKKWQPRRTSTDQP